MFSFGVRASATSPRHRPYQSPLVDVGWLRIVFVGVCTSPGSCSRPARFWSTVFGRGRMGRAEGDSEPECRSHGRTHARNFRHGNRGPDGSGRRSRRDRGRIGLVPGASQRLDSGTACRGDGGCRQAAGGGRVGRRGRRASPAPTGGSGDCARASGHHGVRTCRLGVAADRRTARRRERGARLETARRRGATGSPRRGSPGRGYQARQGSSEHGS